MKITEKTDDPSTDPFVDPSNSAEPQRKRKQQVPRQKN
jgi:hypothetical protein